MNPEDKKPEKQIKAEAGLNRFVWDLRYASASHVPDYYLFEYKDGARGPLARSRQISGPADRRWQEPDRSLGIETRSPPECQLRPTCRSSLISLIQIRDQISRVYDAVNQIQDVRSQVDGLKRRLPENAKPVRDSRPRPGSKAAFGA